MLLVVFNRPQKTIQLKDFALWQKNFLQMQDWSRSSGAFGVDRLQQ